MRRVNARRIVRLKVRRSNARVTPALPRAQSSFPVLARALANRFILIAAFISRRELLDSLGERRCLAAAPHSRWYLAHENVSKVHLRECVRTAGNLIVEYQGTRTIPRLFLDCGSPPREYEPFFRSRSRIFRAGCFLPRFDSSRNYASKQRNRDPARLIIAATIARVDRTFTLRRPFNVRTLRQKSAGRLALLSGRTCSRNYSHFPSKVSLERAQHCVSISRVIKRREIGFADDVCTIRTSDGNRRVPLYCSR